jgi:ABC-type antimicrobial peptide transport system permease subunit
LLLRQSSLSSPPPIYTFPRLPAFSISYPPGGALLSALVPGFWIQTPLWIIPVAVGSAALVGLAAGVLPAWRAAQLDPIDALRAE